MGSFCFRSWWAAFLVLAIAACSEKGKSGGEAGADSGGATDSDADSDGDSDGDADTDSDGDADSDSGVDAATSIPDRTPPETSIDTGPPALYNSAKAEFTFSSPDGDLDYYECSLDEAAFSPCPVPPAFEGLSEESHNLAVSAVDEAGNADPTPASWSWRIDITPPDTFIDAGPPDFTKDASADFVVNCSEPPCTYECALNGAAFGACPEPTTPGVLEYAAVPAGRRILEVRAIDEAGNPDPRPARYHWIIYTDQWKAVDVDSNWACAVSKGGGLWCWGYFMNEYYPELTREPTGASNWDKLAVGSYHLCAITTGKDLYCWGYNYSGPLGQGDTAHRATPTRVGTDSDWVEISAGNGYNCGIRDTGGNRTLWCWGSDYNRVLGQGIDAGAAGDRYVPTQVGADVDWQAVSAGPTEHACATKTNGTAWCWGYSGGGQVGHPYYSNYQAPWPGEVWDVPGENPDAGTTWAKVVAGNQGSCGISSGTNFPGTLWCWGWDFFGEGGYGSIQIAGITARQELLNATDWVDISRLYTLSCGIRQSGDDRTIWCSGRNNYGQAGGAIAPYRTTFAQFGTETDWATVASSAEYVCAIKQDGSLWCWGLDRWAVLGQGIGTAIAVPTEEATRATDWLTVSAGSDHTCGIRDDGTERSLWCWGYNGDGQAGDSSGNPIQVPTRISHCAIDGGLLDGGCADWVSVEAGGSQSCGIRQSGDDRTLWCFGDNGSGELGLGDGGMGRKLYAPEQEVTGATNWTRVEGNWETTLGLQGGTRLGWGDDESGRLGLGVTPGELHAPTADLDAGDWVDLCAGEEHSCGIRNSAGQRRLYCWGTNGSAQLGIADASVQEVDLPVQEVTGALDWLDVACSENATCAVKTGGAIYCWGTDENGSLAMGDGGVDQTFETPTQEVTGASDWISVGVGYGTGCGLTSSHTVRCWGDNSSGNVGNGTWDDTGTPQLVPGISDWVELSVGGSHSCGIRQQGQYRTLWCWGENQNGQIGNGMAWSTIPLPVVNP